ncbi:hypothetical protein [Clostridium celatum]|uniref:Abortive infection protein-like C-terminal domain-containing protein n=1 Tax=Clostridium celatum DSM 1785 TaxID=545697 RepID=L1QM30_9CLOT|nr:hypothetical protein [Clostridium celatum]EKY28627.1 hypothetical protein HMPREF0216_00680 [Clostridium celatum DSM 1785]
MDNREIILSRIAEIMNREYFIVKNNSTFKATLRCVGLGEYFDKYSNYLTPYEYKGTFENHRNEYNVFLGLDGIFSELYQAGKHKEIINLLKELTKSFNVVSISEDMIDDFDELAKMYEVLGLSIKLKDDKILVSTCMSNDIERVGELFSVEYWLKSNYSDVYDAYQAAIDAYMHGHSGACIESCRTCIVSIFSKFKGTEGFSKWVRGVYNISGDSDKYTQQDLSQALKKDLNKDDLADFFKENRSGKLTKTKAIYMIYSMMSDYGTHRSEQENENPTVEDALFSLRLTDSILFWVYSKINR